MLVKTKTPQVTQLEYNVSVEDIRHASNIYPLAQESMSDEIFLPNRNSMLCSRRNCGYWRECEREFGERVRE